MSAGNHRQSGESRVVAVIMVLAFVLAVLNIAMFADGVLSARSTAPSDSVNAIVLATTALPVVVDAATPTGTRQPPTILSTSTSPPPTLAPLPTLEPVQPTATVFMLPTMIPATAAALRNLPPPVPPMSSMAPTATLLPIVAAAPLAPATSAPWPTIPASSNQSLATCDCSANLYNCPDFSGSTDAQACFDLCVAQNAGDIHDLDRDNDSAACEDSWN